MWVCVCVFACMCTCTVAVNKNALRINDSVSVDALLSVCYAVGVTVSTVKSYY